MIAHLLGLFQAFGLWGFLLLCFTEAVFLPVPPEALMIPLCLHNPRLSIMYALLGTAASALGGLFAYFIGKKIGQPILHRLAPNLEQKLDAIFQQYGAWAVFIMSMAPADYKIFTISSGLFGLKITRFLLAALSGRGVRFIAVAVLIMAFGKRAVRFIRRHYIPVSIIIVLLLIMAFLIYYHHHKKSSSSAEDPESIR